MSDELRAAATKACEFAAAIPDYTVLTTPACRAECWIHFQRLAKAWRAEHPADDGEPITFGWLAARAQRHHGDDSDREDVWWEIGPVSFTCDTYQSDPGEPAETVATDWQADGETLPRALVPQTRGQFRRLLAALGVTT